MVRSALEEKIRTTNVGQRDHPLAAPGQNIGGKTGSSLAIMQVTRSGFATKQLNFRSEKRVIK